MSFTTLGELTGVNDELHDEQLLLAIISKHGPLRSGNNKGQSVLELHLIDESIEQHETVALKCFGNVQSAQLFHQLYVGSIVLVWKMSHSRRNFQTNICLTGSIIAVYNDCEWTIAERTPQTLSIIRDSTNIAKKLLCLQDLIASNVDLQFVM
jgi:hypothetical protein